MNEVNVICLMSVLFVIHVLRSIPSKSIAGLSGVFTSYSLVMIVVFTSYSLVMIVVFTSYSLVMIVVCTSYSLVMIVVFTSYSLVMIVAVFRSFFYVKCYCQMSK